ncbi:Helix-turn-helix domain-containing protein [Chryseobacterium carnipullorum]|uniref:helix-turn-helix transcriptional regulator n=1 Tax=Chryseobacterium TaxID=59732 RepID=UPI00067D0A86|nr:MULTISPECIES: helix-turn-helix domain-containing protein [Chryseobacterium]KNB62895.1 hypothetical protein AC804_02375 [Chryseobacterium sp. Hurlbut01]SHL53011.1 Helix-turn-helix domain-containing protein [Chryseobacterium carnipullorum]
MNQIFLQNFTKEELVDDIKNSIFSEIKTIIGKTTHPNDDRLLTRKEVCEQFKIHISTLNRWIKSEILKPHYIGNRVYFKESELPITKKNLI